MNIYRQGDVLLRSLSAEEAEEIRKSHVRKMDMTTVALGEVTGHHHTFVEGDVALYTDAPELSDITVNDMGILVEVTSPEAVIAHQEHAPITIPQGTYIRTMQREYSPAAPVRVRD